MNMMQVLILWYIIAKVLAYVPLYPSITMYVHMYSTSRANRNFNGYAYTTLIDGASGSSKHLSRMTSHLYQTVKKYKSK